MPVRALETAEVWPQIEVYWPEPVGPWLREIIDGINPNGQPLDFSGWHLTAEL